MTADAPVVLNPSPPRQPWRRVFENPVVVKELRGRMRGARAFTVLTIYLLLYASVWRGVAEGVALLTAWVASAHAIAVRRAVEIACQVLYYAGVPVLLGLRFLP